MEYESCPLSRVGFLITIDRVGRRVGAGLKERKHRVGRVGFEAVVAFAPQLDELCRRHVPDDPLRPIREEQRRGRDVAQRECRPVAGDAACGLHEHRLFGLELIDLLLVHGSELPC